MNRRGQCTEPQTKWRCAAGLNRLDFGLNAGLGGGNEHGVNANGLGAVAAQPTLWRLCLVRTWAHGAGEARYSSVTGTVTGTGTIEGYNEFENAGAVPVLSLSLTEK
jgi:hypothetical protein